MYCPKCGLQNLDEARLCGKCAAPLPVGPATPATPAAPAAPWGTGTGQVAGPAVSPGLKLGIGIGSVLLPIIGLVMGILYMVDANPEKKAAGKLWLLLACGGMVMYCMISMASRQ